MHGLPHLQQHIIGDIHDIGDGFLTHQRQPALHPLRGLADLHIIHIMTDIPGAQIRGIHCHRETLLLHRRLGVIQGGHTERLIQHRRHLPGNAHYALAVRPVGRDGNVKNPVVQAQDRFYVRSGLHVLGKHQQTVVACAGKQVLAHSQFHAGAKHSLGFIAPQLPLLNRHDALHGLVVLGRHIHCGPGQRQRIFSSRLHIVRTAAHLKGAMVAGIHPAHMQMRVRDGLTGLHQTRHHIADCLSHLMQLFHFKTTGKKFFLQLLGCHINLHIIL